MDKIGLLIKEAEEILSQESIYKSKKMNEIISGIIYKIMTKSGYDFIARNKEKTMNPLLDYGSVLSDPTIKNNNYLYHLSDFINQEAFEQTLEQYRKSKNIKIQKESIKLPSTTNYILAKNQNELGEILDRYGAISYNIVTQLLENFLSSGEIDKTHLDYMYFKNLSKEKNKLLQKPDTLGAVIKSKNPNNKAKGVKLRENKDTIGELSLFYKSVATEDKKYLQELIKGNRKIIPRPLCYMIHHCLLTNDYTIKKNIFDWEVNEENINMIIQQKKISNMLIKEQGESIRYIDKYFSKIITNYTYDKRKVYAKTEGMGLHTLENWIRKKFHKKNKFDGVRNFFNNIFYMELMKSIGYLVEKNEDREYLLPTQNDDYRGVDFILYEKETNKLLCIDFSEKQKEEKNLNQQIKKMEQSDILSHIYNKYDQKSTSFHYQTVQVDRFLLEQYGIEIIKQVLVGNIEINHAKILNSILEKKPDIGSKVQKIAKEVLQSLKHGTEVPTTIYE